MPGMMEPSRECTCIPWQVFFYCGTGSQCNSHRTGVMWLRLLAPMTCPSPVFFMTRPIGGCIKHGFLSVHLCLLVCLKVLKRLDIAGVVFSDFQPTAGKHWRQSSICLFVKNIYLYLYFCLTTCVNDTEIVPWFVCLHFLWLSTAFSDVNFEDAEWTVKRLSVITDCCWFVLLAARRETVIVQVSQATTVIQVQVYFILQLY